MKTQRCELVKLCLLISTNEQIRVTVKGSRSIVRFLASFLALICGPELYSQGGIMFRIVAQGCRDRVLNSSYHSDLNRLNTPDIKLQN